MGVGEHWEKQKPRYIARGRTKESNYTGEGFVKSKLICECADLVATNFTSQYQDWEQKVKYMCVCVCVRGGAHTKFFIERSFKRGKNEHYLTWFLGREWKTKWAYFTP